MSRRFIKLVGISTTEWVPIESITSITTRGHSTKPTGWADSTGAEVFIANKDQSVQLPERQWRELESILTQEFHINEIVIRTSPCPKSILGGNRQ